MSEVDFSKQREGTGTKEWAEHNVNICRGCSHDCLYCYARARALRFKQINDSSEWPTEVINQKAVNKRYGRKDGVIMFPTTHDITPNTLRASIVVLDKLVMAGNKILIVSKPHLDCIQEICYVFRTHKGNIMFRFTIGSLDPVICKAWEPGAPDPLERREALKYAFNNGFATSVSMEPMLDNAPRTIQWFNDLAQYVTDKIWIGKMNKINLRVKVTDYWMQMRIDKVKHDQRDEAILFLYDQLKDHPKVAWKDSIKEVISGGEIV